MLKIDPALFRPEAVSPETRAHVEALEAALAVAPKPHETPVEASRQARIEGRGVFPPAGPLPGSEWVKAPTVPGRARLTPAPGAPTGLYIHIHGGGWTLGLPDQYDRWNQHLAQETGCAVLSIQYRLAPENPWPACAEDCEAGAVWALEEAARMGASRVVIGGESAGAHLSVVTLLRLRARGMAGRIAGANLSYGVFDVGLTPSARNWGARQLVLSTPTMDWFSGNLGPVDKTSPEVSPLRADLSGMPPALFQVGTEDPLMDDSLLMAARWAASGVEARLEVHPGGVHGFDMFDIGIGRAARANSAAFLKACFAA
ncbi:MAG: alpha/beta hydrolase [Pikeienuella sp.]|uniref:alpha/beta hydrolase n=1 Tax=Pikeienuella sp. TaxID=2831957 RepID=UPI003918F67A